MIPWGGLVVGIVLSNLWQWLAWKQKNGKAPWVGYWEMGFVHLGMNLIVDSLVGVCWYCGWLDDFVGLMAKWTPGASDWVNVGLPYTPQVGILIGFGADLFGDQAAFIARRILGLKFPTLAPTQPPVGP